MYALLAQAPEGHAASVQLWADDGTPAEPARTVVHTGLAAVVLEIEREHQPRWVWDRAQHWYPELLAAGVRVERCHDLALCQNILVHSEFSASTGYRQLATILPPETAPDPAADQAQESLFDGPAALRGWELQLVAAELKAQKSAIASSTHPARLTLLLSAESACALVAAEMQNVGIPWREDLHRRLLNELLGPEPAGYARPEKMDALAAVLRTALDAPGLNPDSPQELVKALHRAGIDAKSTRSWELKEIKHPAIEPLLAYRKLSRLFTTNGWAWLRQWVTDGRFHSEYLVGGVVSGRWASRGGGAMQIPKQIRGAARAEPGHKFIVADAAQLEPRVLAALAQDSAMAAAGRDKDLYAGIAAQGFGGERAMAKVALLGAIYGSTTGESGRLMPQLARMYPKAVGFVEEAARAGERGEQVSTWLGRSTPPVSAQWREGQRSSTAEEQRRAESAARSRGRFTRNFVVQGTAAEWACCWLAELRRRLRALPPIPEGRPELVFFLHDEVMVHCPDPLVDAVTEIVHESSRAATRLLFGEIPLAFPVNATVVENYADAK
ncbi:DNA polymerase-1 [Arthrobacter silviterrae]|uniref:DNA-directed DNA polymerase n=1 Tax=Arthrobacter silviterrae TaxID=2026658 RepID=A0ABX0DG46_9MICC|nr:bifunctional 3'-5' exonuclease/DNA polymerase [Arthrobacter silviterrae]MDQ0277914.1 DNA polymerase-1 [Arthrobacter silviterrae]NGN84750.1 bifunctional 3'-5' exonuclease/DNA polymerase [Arthrobacter silviterrae]